MSLVLQTTHLLRMLGCFSLSCADNLLNPFLEMHSVALWCSKILHIDEASAKCVTQLPARYSKSIVLDILIILLLVCIYVRVPFFFFPLPISITIYYLYRFLCLSIRVSVSPSVRYNSQIAERLSIIEALCIKCFSYTFALSYILHNLFVKITQRGSFGKRHETAVKITKIFIHKFLRSSQGEGI